MRTTVFSNSLRRRIVESRIDAVLMDYAEREPIFDSSPTANVSTCSFVVVHRPSDDTNRNLLSLSFGFSTMIDYFNVLSYHLSTNLANR